MSLTNSDLESISILFRTELKTELAPINNRLDSLEGRFDSLEGRFDSLEMKVDKLEADVSALKSGQKHIRQELKRIDNKVSDTYDLALDAWGTSTENRTWIEETAQG